MPNMGSLSQPHDQEVEPVVHGLSPGHPEVGRPNHYMPNLGSLSHSHGLEEVPVVHQPGPEHLGEVG